MLLVAATTRPDSLDPAVRRSGRFDREISLGIPDEPARLRSADSHMIHPAKSIPASSVGQYSAGSDEGSASGARFPVPRPGPPHSGVRGGGPEGSN